jgi:hypothetical protein
MRKNFRIFSSSFVINIKTVPDKFQLELQTYSVMKTYEFIFRDTTLTDLSKLYSPCNKFLVLNNQAQQMISLSESTNVWSSQVITSTPYQLLLAYASSLEGDLEELQLIMDAFPATHGSVHQCGGHNLFVGRLVL